MADGWRRSIWRDLTLVKRDLGLLTSDPYWLLRRLARRIPLPLLPILAPVVTGQIWILLFARNASGTWMDRLRCAARGTDPKAGGWVVLGGAAAAALLVTRRIAVRSPEGPIEIGPIEIGPIEIGPIEADARTTRGRTTAPTSAAIAAILSDRLARAAVQDQGAMPGHDALDVGTESGVASPLALSGFVARMGLGFLQRATTRMGWRLAGTLRRADATGEWGLTIELEHVATHRRDLVRTVWASSWPEAARKAAYEVAAWQMQRLVGPSRRHRPTWRPSGAALKAYEDAVFLNSERRYDEAIEAALAGLEADPGFPIRRELGEVYERLGQFLNAVDVYAAGLALARDRENGWSSTSVQREGERWPPRHRKLTSPEVGGILWRYIAVLSFADQWVDRWVGQLERLDAESYLARHHPLAPRVEARLAPAVEALREYADNVVQTYKPWQPSLLKGDLAVEHERERVDRDEQARRLRGFINRRYTDLLDAEFPVLKTALFDEEHKRTAPMVIAGTAPRCTVRFRWTSVPEASDALPLDRWGNDPNSSGPWRPTPVVPPSDEVMASTLDAVRAALQLHTGAGGCLHQSRALLEAVRLALTEGGDPHAAPWPTRQGLVSILSHLCTVVQESHCPLEGGAPVRCDSRPAGQDRRQPRSDLTMLADFRRSVDLRLFLQRAVIDEMSRLRSRREARVTMVASPRLQEMMWLSARSRMLQRIHRLGLEPERHFGQSDNGEATTTEPEDEGRISPSDAIGKVRLETASRVRQVTNRRSAWSEAWRSRITGSPGEWNLWYYAACIMAISMQTPPLRRLSPDQEDDRSRLFLWYRRNDPLAELAIWALDQAILTRRSGGISAIEAGVARWMLFQDPDLEALRSHPRFVRWSSATFGAEVVPTPYSPLDQKLPPRGGSVDRREMAGAFGVSGHRLNRTQRLWRFTNDLYLRRILTNLAGQAAAEWRRSGDEIRRTGFRPGAASALAHKLMIDCDLWAVVRMAHRHSSRPDLRLKLGRLMRALDPTLTAQPVVFPTVLEVVRAGPVYRGSWDFDYPVFIERYVAGEHEAASHAARLLLEHAQGLRPLEHQDVVTLMDEAAERWDRLGSSWVEGPRPIWPVAAAP